MKRSVSKRRAKHQFFAYDRWLLFSTAALLIYGVVMVASASMAISDQHFGYPFYFLLHDLVYLCIGVVVGWYTTRIPLKIWRDHSAHLIVLGIVLLAVVLLPGIGRTVNGSRRWINLIVVTLQVSELVKLCVVLYIAHYLARFQQLVQSTFLGFLKPIGLLAILALLLLAEPDFGAVAIITMIIFGLLFLAGARLWIFLVLALLGVGALAFLSISSPYRLLRLTTFLHPWANAYGSGYQLTQSLIAFGRGGFHGVGLGNSIQKLFYLPEAHTDFLFAVLAEELGFVGEMLLIGLFSVLVGRAFLLAKEAFRQRQLFPGFLSAGFGLWFSMQAIINMGVNAGMFPTKGLTLPFISYGGSSMIVNCVVAGLLLRISYEIGISRK